jgi:hypothetical protein
MEQSPFLDKTASRSWKMALDHSAIGDCEDALVALVHGMEMRRRMVVEEHADRDAVEPGDRGQALIQRRLAGASG